MPALLLYNARLHENGSVKNLGAVAILPTKDFVVRFAQVTKCLRLDISI